jgi:hypothetical protein
MVRWNFDIPPEAARDFVADMLAYHAETNGHLRDQIAARQARLLNDHLPSKSKRMTARDVTEVFKIMNGGAERTATLSHSRRAAKEAGSGVGQEAPRGDSQACGDDAMKQEYDFTGAERGKFFRKLALSALPQTETGGVFVDREGYTIVVFAENIHIEVNTMQTSRYGKRVIPTPIKKRIARVQPRKRRLTIDFRETVRARAERDPAFREALSDEIKRGLRDGSMSEATATRMRRSAGLSEPKKKPAPET